MRLLILIKYSLNDLNPFTIHGIKFVNNLINGDASKHSINTNILLEIDNSLIVPPFVTTTAF